MSLSLSTDWLISGSQSYKYFLCIPFVSLLTKGTAFMDLVDEGRLLSHSTRERIVITGSEALDIMKDRDNMENLKHAQFETLCTKTMIAFIGQYKTYDQFFKAKKKRNTSSATQSLEKV